MKTDSPIVNISHYYGTGITTTERLLPHWHYLSPNALILSQDPIQGTVLHSVINCPQAPQGCKKV